MRDQAMGVLFGAGPVMDSFTVAFRLPNLARVLLGEGALTTAFLPVFVSDLRERGSESAARVTWAVFWSLAAFLCAMIVLFEGAIWSLGWFMQLSPEATLLRNLSALLMPYVVLICLAAHLGAVLNALGKFVWPALVPSILNLVWLLSLWLLAPLWKDDVHQACVIGVCVLIGGGLQLLFPLIVLYTSGFGFRSDWRLAMDRVWKIATGMLPVIIGMSVTQLNAVLDSFIAWGFTQPADLSLLMPLPGSPKYPLPAGTATALYLGQRLYQFPLGVFGVALGTVLFPLFTSHAQRGETDKLRADLSLGVRLVIAIGLPASVGLILIGHPLATLFFEYGKFNADDAHRTGDMIAAYGAGVWAYCGLLILQRGFYAIGDRLTPMYIGMAAMFANLILNLTLIWPLGGCGVALATALVAAGQSTATALVLQRRVGSLHWGEIGKTTMKTILATAVMSAACQVLLNLLGAPGLVFGRAIRLGVPLAVGAIAFLLCARLIGLVEPWLVVSGKRMPDPNLES